MTFFVTHYPQLSKLASVYSNVQNQHLGASVPSGGRGDVKYSHKIQPGPCKMASDYGVEMAATCGWPADVVADAREVRAEVEEKLPDGALVEDEIGKDRKQNVRRKAEEVLSKLAIRLVALKESDGRLSVEAKRSYLQEVRDFVSSQQDQELVEMIKRLLSEDEESRDLSPLPLGRIKGKPPKSRNEDAERSENGNEVGSTTSVEDRGKENVSPGDDELESESKSAVGIDGLDKSSHPSFSERSVGRLVDKVPDAKREGNPKKIIDDGRISSSPSTDSSSSTSRLDTPKPSDKKKTRATTLERKPGSSSTSSSSSSSSSSDDSSSSSNDDSASSTSSSSSSSSDSSMSSV